MDLEETASLLQTLSDCSLIGRYMLCSPERLVVILSQLCFISYIENVHPPREFLLL